MAGLFRVKIMNMGEERIVSVCDEELLGKVLVDEKRKIKIRIDEPFYGGDLMELDEALEVISSSTQANLIGNRIVEAAIERGLVIREGVIEIAGVKHTQIILDKV
ncbi:hypothetical protein ATG_11850 [Desulfurococcaceae archaeon AG1]|jgi:hypothetical protein|nr:MAG: DUF424 domain-containing protein [Desulfurococcaceae archaeon]GAY25982.1 hypothetical protein ATG_11850 [Desulfurococcaceae archaeon AG1]